MPAQIPIVIYLGSQVAISQRMAGRRSDLIDTARLLLAVAAVVTISLQSGQVIDLPLFGLYIPIVAMAAAIGWRSTAAVGGKLHGHATGDAVLRTFGAILSRRLRSSDLVARFGGEEFVAVLDGASLDEARRVADEIRRELQAAALTGSHGETLTTTVSAGCASLGPDVASFETLLEIADVGLQMAKRGGRNQVVAA